jgi:hypothetical protein
VEDVQSFLWELAEEQGPSGHPSLHHLNELCVSDVNQVP